MLELMKENWHQLKEGKPGRRFRDYYDERKEHRRGRAAKIATIAGGLALIVIGLAIGWLPGPGGFVAIIGLILLVKEIRPLAAAMDWCERTGRKCWHKLRGDKPAGQPRRSLSDAEDNCSEPEADRQDFDRVDREFAAAGGLAAPAAHGLDGRAVQRSMAAGADQLNSHDIPRSVDVKPQ